MIEVRIRHEDDENAIHFANVDNFSDCQILIEDIHTQGGVYFSNYSQKFPYIERQYVVENGHSYIELIFGKE